MKRNINLTKLTSDDVYTLLEDIPSEGSDVSESDENEDEVTDMTVVLDVLDEQDNILDEQDDVRNATNYTFDSEDELPLITFCRNEVKWTTNPNNASRPLPFSENVGPNVPDNLETPLDFFLHLFSENLLNTLVFQTNLYAVQKHNKNNAPTTIEEIKCFLGINLLMGIKKMPSYRDFWSSSYVLRDQFISSCMSRDRKGNRKEETKDGTSEEINCEQLVRDYNRYMGFVDKSDMLKSCYELDRKSKRMSLKEFKIAVATGLIGADPQLPKLGRRSVDKPSTSNKFKIQVPLEIRTDKAAHMPQHGSKVRCTHCSTKAVPHRTRWHCTACNVGLCLSEKKNCFIPFHA
ncbi:hypothetical protein NQ314_002808 [Rhamnusium bicolor]|uniref:PiggyBac transposable element-derived protein domain-containing protein n=1 Tax=Rhamnusium bicolor TaxID=1586634 RepID=A0AAV8ZQV0_9CUCU|nr:hypothetical protein NQ314_002808 [Rhamnusium bicolor]